MSEYVAACERILRDAGLNPKLHAYGTNVEGPWDAVMAALKQCNETIHQMGTPRISTTMRVESIAAKIKSVEDKL